MTKAEKILWMNKIKEATIKEITKAHDSINVLQFNARMPEEDLDEAFASMVADINKAINELSNISITIAL